MIKEIKEWYVRFKSDFKATVRTVKRALTITVIMSAICLAFHGHIFSAVVIGGITYIFWRNKKGQDQLVGTA